MALIHCNFYSEVLNKQMAMYVILPEGKAVRAGGHKTLYLLHGHSDDHTIWLRRTSIERYVSELDLAVVMPNVDKSYYTDMAHGDNYWKYISEELPVKARAFFPLSDKREDNFAAGLSMGGYGAFKLALAKPEQFAAAASLSGAVDMVRWAHDSSNGRTKFWDIIFGGADKIKGTDNDLFHLVEKLAASGKPQPRLYQWCGTEDFLYFGNVAFRDHARKFGLDLTYEEGPGDHSWVYWDRQIQRVLEWLKPFF